MNRGWNRCGAWLPGIALVLVFAVGLPAQTTWIVDANNGPGTNFTDLPPAVQAAAPGDTIIVRGNGSYTGGIISKGVRIVGEWVLIPQGLSPPRFTLPFKIEGIPHGETLVLSNVGFVIGIVEVNNCAGAVVFNDVRLSWGYLSFDNCSSVWLDSCDLTPLGSPTTFKNSTVLIQNSKIWALSWSGAFPSSAIDSEDSHLRIVDSDIRGANDFYGYAQPGIYSFGSTMEIAGTSLIKGGAYFYYPWATPPLFVYTCGILFLQCSTNPSTLVVAPTATIWADCSLYPSFPANCLTRTDRPIPALAATTLDPPNPLTITHYGHPSSLQFLFFGAPASTPITLPFGDIWLAPPLTNILVGYMGLVSLNGIGYATTTWTVPPTIPLGQPFAIQAVELKTNGAFEATVPGITLRH